MADVVSAGALLQCSFGVSPSVLNVLPACRILLQGMPIASVMDHLPLVNIMPFGLCRSLANPMVAVATATAMGVLTPMPCLPVTPAPWLPLFPKALIGPFPVLTKQACLFCAWGGSISIKNTLPKLKTP